MSLVISREDGSPVHFPKNKNMFQFDSEVAEIFEDMAQRSIPMYSEIHKLHFSLIRDSILEAGERGDKYTVFDIGASTGKWFQTIRDGFKVPDLRQVYNLECHAFDNSAPMLSKLKGRFPDVSTHHLDLCNPSPVTLKANVIAMFYVLQFIPDAEKLHAMQWVYDHMETGSVLLLGQKEKYSDDVQKMFQEEYFKFRLANGYTRKEIDAKTKALENSMWCVSNDTLRGLLHAAGFRKTVDTSRWLHFNTMMVFK